MKKIISLFIIILLSSSFLMARVKFNVNRKFISKLNNKAFNGTYSKKECFPKCGKWYSQTRETELAFNKTNRFLLTQKINGSIKFHRYMEIEVKGNKYRYRRWNFKTKTSWSAYYSFKFNRSELTLINFLKETYVLTK